MVDFQQLASFSLFLVLLALGFVLVTIAFIPISFGITVNTQGRDRLVTLILGIVLLLCCFWFLTTDRFAPSEQAVTQRSASTQAQRFGDGRTAAANASSTINDCNPHNSGGDMAASLNIRNSRSTDAPQIAVINCPQSQFQSVDSQFLIELLELGGSEGLNQGWAKIRYEATGWVARDRLGMSPPDPIPGTPQ